MLNKVDNALTKIEGFIIGAMMLGTTIILFFNVIFRSFSMASTWAEEAIRYIIVWVTFFGGSLCAKYGNHVGIDVFVQMIPSKILQRVVRAIGFLAAAVFCGIVTYSSFKLTSMAVSYSQKSPAMMMPFWIVYVSMPLGFALMTIRFLVAAINALTGKDEKPAVAMTDEGDVDMTYL